QGEELGTGDAEVSPEQAQDPIAARAGEHRMGRDRARTPMPWTAAPDRGFSTGTPWLPHGALPPCGAADQQDREPASHLRRWRSLLAAWREHRSALPGSAEVTTDG